jgi:hypothetical protein
LQKAFLLWVFSLIIGTTSCQGQPLPASAFVPTGEPALSLDYNYLRGDKCPPDLESFGDYFCQSGELHLVNTGHVGIAGLYYNMPELAGLRNYMLQGTIHSVDESGAYGLTFRDNGPSTGIYIFRVRSGGDFELILWSQYGEKVLFPWTASPAIHRGTAVNLLEVTARGNHFTLFANGEALASVDNDILSQGWPGVVAMDGGHAAVSRLSVWKLP